MSKTQAQMPDNSEGSVHGSRISSSAQATIHRGGEAGSVFRQEQVEQQQHCVPVSSEAEGDDGRRRSSSLQMQGSISSDPPKRKGNMQRIGRPLAPKKASKVKRFEDGLPPPYSQHPTQVPFTQYPNPSPIQQQDPMAIHYQAQMMQPPPLPQRTHRHARFPRVFPDGHVLQDPIMQIGRSNRIIHSASYRSSVPQRQSGSHEHSEREGHTSESDAESEGDPKYVEQPEPQRPRPLLRDKKTMPDPPTGGPRQRRAVTVHGRRDSHDGPRKTESDPKPRSDRRPSASRTPLVSPSRSQTIVVRPRLQGRAVHDRDLDTRLSRPTSVSRPPLDPFITSASAYSTVQARVIVEGSRSSRRESLQAYDRMSEEH